MYECFKRITEGTKGQYHRNWCRKNVFSKTKWHVFIALSFTLLHDIAGLFSASTTVISRVPIESTVLKLFVIYLPIVVFDCVSEIMLVYYHDIPLCDGTFKDGEPSREQWFMIRLALFGQILTALSWAILFGCVVYFSVFSKCDIHDPEDLANCKVLLPGFTEAFVILIVLLKNAMTLKEYNERVTIYPIICKEELFYLSRINSRQDHTILSHFEKYHSLSTVESTDIPLTARAEFNVAINYIMLIFFDIAGLASVSTLIVVHGATLTETVFRALPFAIILVVDITSESTILAYHDIPLLRGHDPKKFKHIFDPSRAAQVAVNFAWLGVLIYMVYVVANGPQCVPECSCLYCTPDGICGNDTTAPSQCYRFTNDTYIPMNLDPDYTYYNCTVTYTEGQCKKESPSVNSCVLLFLVLLDSFYAMGQMFFRSYIYPLTVPEYVLFLAYYTEDKNKIIDAIRQNEYGWDDELQESMLDSNVELDEPPNDSEQNIEPLVTLDSQ